MPKKSLHREYSRLAGFLRSLSLRLQLLVALQFLLLLSSLILLILLGSLFVLEMKGIFPYLLLRHHPLLSWYSFLSWSLADPLLAIRETSSQGAGGEVP
jgi:hypothetical protein